MGAYLRFFVVPTVPSSKLSLTFVNGSAISTTFSTGSAKSDSIRRLTMSTKVPMMLAGSKEALFRAEGAFPL